MPKKGCGCVARKIGCRIKYQGRCWRRIAQKLSNGNSLERDCISIYMAPRNIHFDEDEQYWNTKKHKTNTHTHPQVVSKNTRSLAVTFLLTPTPPPSSTACAYLRPTTLSPSLVSGTSSPGSERSRRPTVKLCPSMWYVPARQ